MLPVFCANFLIIAVFIIAIILFPFNIPLVAYYCRNKKCVIKTEIIFFHDFAVFCRHWFSITNYISTRMFDTFFFWIRIIEWKVWNVDSCWDMRCWYEKKTARLNKQMFFWYRFFATIVCDYAKPIVKLQITRRKTFVYVQYEKIVTKMWF